MDYAGLDFGRLRYPVNRSLTDDERANRLDQKTPLDVSPNDYLSVIDFNSTYLDLVDRWYPVKGFNTWVGFLIGAVLLFVVGFFGWALVFDTGGLDPDEQWVPWVGWGLLIPLGLLFLYGAFSLVRTECFRWTHYPMRLNRKSRQVHVFQQDGSVLVACWDDLYIVLADAFTPFIGKTYDLRAHVLQADGKTVEASFSLGYVFAGNQDSIRRLWEFVRRYMESDSGVPESFHNLEFLMPLKERREGFAFGVLRTFMTFLHWPALQLVFSIPFSWIAVGRWFAMSTGEIPAWPDDVLASGLVGENDPYQKDWRANPPFTSKQIYWPWFCFLFGIAVSIAILVLVVHAAL